MYANFTNVVAAYKWEFSGQRPQLTIVRSAHINYHLIAKLSFLYTFCRLIIPFFTPNRGQVTPDPKMTPKNKVWAIMDEFNSLINNEIQIVPHLRLLKSLCVNSLGRMVKSLQ